MAGQVRRGVLRFRHPLSFGALLERDQIALFLPIATGTPALSIAMAAMLVLEFDSASTGRLAGTGAFATFLLFFGTWWVCVLSGHALRERLEIPPVLAARIRLEPDFCYQFERGLRSSPRLRYVLLFLLFLTGGNLKVALWVAMAIVWSIVFVSLWGLVSGELVPATAG